MYDVGKMGNGALCGLAAITASCAVVHPWAAIVIGLVAGFGFVCFSQLVIWCRLDDPLDAISVHAFGGVWGVFATGEPSPKAWTEGLKASVQPARSRERMGLNAVSATIVRHLGKCPAHDLAPATGNWLHPG